MFIHLFQIENVACFSINASIINLYFIDVNYYLLNIEIHIKYGTPGLTYFPE